MTSPDPTHTPHDSAPWAASGGTATKGTAPNGAASHRAVPQGTAAQDTADRGTDGSRPAAAPAPTAPGRGNDAAAPAPAHPGTSRRMAVSAAHVSRTYGAGGTAVQALRDVSLEIPEGTFVAVMGPSGSGKSTLVHCLAGLDTPDRNPETRITVGGQDIAGLSDDQLTRFRRDHVGFVFQAFNLVPTLTARQNIELPLSLAGKKVDTARLDALATTLQITKRLDHRPDEMSGGQQQRVAIARALLSQPDVVIADEPTGALDSATSQEVLALLRRCVDELGQTVVVVTHDATVAEAADRVVRVRDGQIVADDARGGAR